MSGIQNKEQIEVVYFKFGGLGNGASLQDAAPLVDKASAAVLPAGFVAKSADVVILETVVGLTAIAVGDAADADGLVAAADVGAFTPAVYAGGGAYIAADGKHYTSAGALALDVTGTASAGAIAVVVKGYTI